MEAFRNLLQENADIKRQVEELKSALNAANNRLLEERIRCEQAEEALQRERRLFAGGPAIIFRWRSEENWPVEYVSPNVTQWGFNPDDFTSGRLPYASIVHPDDVPRIAAELQAHNAAVLDSFEQDYRIFRASGEVRWVCDFTAAVRNDRGEVTHYEGYVLDITHRVLAEKALQEAKDQLQAVLDAVPGCVSWIGSDLKYLGVNRYLAKTFGRTPADFVGKELGFMKSAGELKEFLSEFFASPAREASQEMAFARRQDAGAAVGGKRHHILVAQKYLQGEAAVCVGVDITELKEAQQALQLSEEKFSKAFRCSPNCITISTLKEGRYIDVNETSLRILGYRREEVIGRTVTDLNIWVEPQDRERMTQALQERGAVDNMEVKIRTKTGEVRVGLLSAEIVEIAGERCLVAATNDITERVRAEEKLRAAQERDRLLAEIALRIRQSLDLDNILNSTVCEIRQVLKADRVYIGYLDDNSDALVVAESVAAGFPPMLGYALKRDIYFRKVKALFDRHPVGAVADTSAVPVLPYLAQHYADYQIKASLAVRIVVDEKPFGLLVAHQCSGARCWQPFEIELLDRLATQVAIAIKQGQLYQRLAALNANLEKQVEERTAQLQQRNRELQELNQMKDLFLHAVTHDLRTPVIGALLVWKNLLNSSAPGAGGSQPPAIPVARSILERMVQGSERQLKLINSLLDVHASEVRGIALQREQVRLGELIESIVEYFQPLLAKNQATLRNKVRADLPVLSADSGQLWRVFENLIANALHHNPPGLSLTVTAAVEGGEGEQSDSQMIRCALQDNGVGMSEEQCEELFELYARGSQTRRSTGLGLGLYLCRQIIAAHGGKIGVISSLGAGATFWFTLPVVDF
ncbi:PAS domain-containing sensor histidine kinase [Kamptonema formosum]|uniref:PAS domain-containing sensor histidine kinase n=1 Tax=Kamptonema formosum TaxID=331992 RepID=UPI0018E1FC64|nr:PAS domain S-box protein [Oscillatoria sp. PCC 10802]